jgi:hypothetical protein
MARIIFSTGASFLFLLLVFRPLELAFPAKPGQRLLRPHFVVDLCFFLGQYLIWERRGALGAHALRAHGSQRSFPPGSVTRGRAAAMVVAGHRGHRPQ